ncbi:MAG: methionine adenosyltransferase [bacterium]
MGRNHYFLTSESVTEGHPDKIADQISDAVLDSIYEKDPNGRVACETLVTTGLAFVAGEISTNCYVDIPKIVRETIRDIGYTRAKYGFDYETCAVITAIQEQSPDIALGVDVLGAGDQGLMYGYATKETSELMPLPIMLAHKLVRQLADVRKKGILEYIRPDGKSQVTIEYKDGRPARVDTVVISAQHSPEVSLRQIREDVVEKVILPILPRDLYDPERITFHINPTGRFVVGGPQGDTGLTGRKIIADTYGGVGSHGGGCFSGKDPTKVDRSGSYAARYIAKNIVAANLAEKCEVQLAYAIGVQQPISVVIDTKETGTVPDDEIQKAVRKHFDFSPAGIIKALDLRRPIFKKTAAYGHFGRMEPEFTWEKVDLVEALTAELKTS